MSQYHLENDLELCKRCEFYYLIGVEGEGGLCDACRDYLKAQNKEQDDGSDS